MTTPGIQRRGSGRVRQCGDARYGRFTWTPVSARRLGNGGVLLEMDSQSAAGWLNVPATRPSFLNRFAPNTSVKERAFPLASGTIRSIILQAGEGVRNLPDREG